MASAGICCWCNSKTVLSMGWPWGSCSAGFSLLDSTLAVICWAGWNSATFSSSFLTLAAHPEASTGGVPLPPLPSEFYFSPGSLKSLLQVLQVQEGTEGTICVIWVCLPSFSPALASSFPFYCGYSMLGWDTQKALSCKHSRQDAGHMSLLSCLSTSLWDFHHPFSPRDVDPRGPL